MATDQLSLLCTYMLAVSLANERLITLIKSFIPWLAKEPLDPNGLIDPDKERKRVLILQIISLACATITTLLLRKSGSFTICIGDKEETCLPFWIILVLSTGGGSAFWSSLLGYANAVKDIKKQERANQRLNLASRAQTLGISPAKVSTL